MNYKPILKWVGGKTQILPELLKKFPKTINNYYEPFLGGGSVLIGLLSSVEKGEIQLKGKIYASDLNADLIYLFQQIKDLPLILITQLETYQKLYDKAPMIEHPPRFKHLIDLNDEVDISEGKTHLYYYWREKYNNSTDAMTRAVLMMVLNKTCFRGLYRTGKNGFNVPFGNYEKPTIYDKDEIMALHQLFNKYQVNFEYRGFKEGFDEVGEGDFVYFDPPYHELNKDSFQDYQDGWNLKKEVELQELCYELDKKGVQFVQSNSYCQYNLDLYGSDFKIDKILCRRRINSKNPEDKEYEMIISNIGVDNKGGKFKDGKMVNINGEEYEMIIPNMKNKVVPKGKMVKIRVKK